MEKLEEQIHLKNIVTCLKELSDYAHYLSYERFTLDRELHDIIIRNLSLAGQEAFSLYEQGITYDGLKYLAGLHNLDQKTTEEYAIYSLLQNDLDYLMHSINGMYNDLSKVDHSILERQSA